MILKDIVLKNRSYRRFFGQEHIDISLLKEWVNNARLTPSARNAQPLKYMLCNTGTGNEKIFDCLAWASFLKDWDGPVEGERPSAYIIMLSDTKIAGNFYCDHGIASQTILLSAVEAGYGGCIIASVKRGQLREAFGISEQFDIIQVLALGKPKEVVVIEKMIDDDFKYWRDDNQLHHVPKRDLDNIITIL